MFDDDGILGRNVCGGFQVITERVVGTEVQSEAVQRYPAKGVSENGHGGCGHGRQADPQQAG